MKSKVAKVSAICAGVITLGTAATLSAVLLTSGNSLSDYSDKDLIKNGFETLFSGSDSCKINDIIKNLGDAFTTSGDITINSLYGEDISSPISMGYIANGDMTDNKTNFYAYIDSDEFADTIDFDLYIDDEIFAVASNLLNYVLYVNHNTFVEDYKNSAFYDDDLTFTQEDINSIIEHYSVSYSDERLINLQAKLNAKLKEDLDTIIENMETERDEDSETVNGYETYRIVGNMNVSDITTLVFNQLQTILTDDDFIDYCNEFRTTYGLYSPYSSLYYNTNTDDDDVRTVFSQLSLGLTLGYSEIEASVKSAIGNTIPVEMYYTDDASLVKAAIPVTVTDDHENNMKFITSIERIDTNSINDSYKLSLKITNDENALNITFKNQKTSNGRELSFMVFENDDEYFKINSTFETNGDDFSNETLIYLEEIEIARLDFDGTCKVTDNSIDLDVTKLKLTASANTLLDIALKFNIKPLENEIEVPSGTLKNIFELTEDEFNNDVRSDLGIDLYSPVKIAEENRQKMGDFVYDLLED